MTAASRISSIRRAGAKAWLPALLFALTVALTVFVTWHATLYCLDGDASSELVLANHLNEIGRPLSSQWYYSTELRVLNTQLIFAPLFSVFSDWHMVRFVGTLILQALMVLSFFYLGKEIQLSWGARFLGGSLLLLPMSVTYGRDVLYQAYYIPHLSLGFMIIALFISSMRQIAQKRLLPAFIRFSLLCALSLGSGLGGIRQGMITHVPLILVLVICMFQDAKDLSLGEVLHRYWKRLALAAAALIAFGLGYIVNTRYLSSRFVFSDYNGLMLRLLEAETLPNILFALLHFFGFRENIQVLSILGILSAGGLFSCVYCLIQSAPCFADTQRRLPFEHRALRLFPLVGVCVILCIFFFVDFGGIFTLYMVPAAIWFIPMLAVDYDAFPRRAALLRRGDVCLLLTLTLIVSNGLANAAYFSSNGKLFAQKYDGQWHNEIETAKNLEKPVAFLQENGYELGYAEFWYASPVTEMSDGGIKMINILINQYGRPMIRHEWLMLQSTFDMEAEKTFLLLTSYHDRAYATMPYEYKGERVYDDGNYVIYHFDDPEVLKEYTGWEYGTRSGQ